MKIADITFVVLIVLLSNVFLVFEIMTIYVNCLKTHGKPQCDSYKYRKLFAQRLHTTKIHKKSELELIKFRSIITVKYFLFPSYYIRQRFFEKSLFFKKIFCDSKPIKTKSRMNPTSCFVIVLKIFSFS